MVSLRIFTVGAGDEFVNSTEIGGHRDSILIARNLGPAELLEYDRRRLKGVILEEGSLTAHMVIVARAMDIAAGSAYAHAMALDTPLRPHRTSAPAAGRRLRLDYEEKLGIESAVSSRGEGRS
jgi:hypothetical protein